MTYDEIIQISDSKEREEKLIEFYKNTLKIDEWMTNTNRQKIHFKDRWEYKENGKHHRLDGPAIEFHDGTRGFYYIEGKQMDEKEWKEKSTQILREKKLLRSLK